MAEPTLFDHLAMVKVRPKRHIHPGVYCIQNRINGKRYIGSASNVDARWRLHRSQLRRGVHNNRHLQRSWNKHGESAFSWRLIESVRDATLLVACEQKWMDLYNCCDRRFGYNICSVAFSIRGLKRSRKTRRLLSKAAKGNARSANKHYHGVLTEQDVSFILHRLSEGVSPSTLAKQFNVSTSTIYRIEKRKIWWSIQIPIAVSANLKSRRTNRAKGEQSGMSKLTREQVIAIRARAAAGEVQRVIAEDYHVTQGLISAVVRRRIWRHV